MSGRDEEDEESTILTEFSDATTLSWTTRLKGFLICFVTGILFSISATFFLMIPGLVGVRLFAVFYTFGNLIALVSTCFLMGPLNQLKRMFAETRFIAAILVFFFLIFTILAAVVWKNAPLAMIFCGLQFLAFTWYGLTYIPFARDAVKSCVNGCLGL